MQKKKNLYCFDCGKTTPHAYAGRKAPFEGLGPVRAISAIASLGMSETVGASHYWQCEVCGHVKKHG